MKRVFQTLAVAALALFATSCTNDSERVAPGTKVTLSFMTTSQTSRAIGEAENINTLHVNVYSADGTVHYPNASKVVENYNPAGQSVELELVSGMSYKISFWAQCNAVHSVDGAQHRVTIADFDGNSDMRDAFFAIEEVAVRGSDSKDVLLYRPFAQLNFGASDFEAATNAGFDLSGITLSTKSYTEFDLLTGGVSNLQDVTFKADARMKGYVPTAKGTYDWITMDYILMNEDLTFDTTLTVSNSAGNPIVISQPGVPFKRNWRTNVIGTMFTVKKEFVVEVIPGFDGEIPVEY